MRIKKLAVLLLITLCILLFPACRLPGENTPSGNSPDVTPAEPPDPPTALQWTKTSNTSVHIVSFGTSPSSQTVSFDFGYDMPMLKNQGYSQISFTLTFDVFVDDGINVSTVVNAYLTNNDKKEFGVGWSHLRFTNTKSNTVSYDKTIDIASILQKRGNIYRTFEAVENTLFTGTYISNITIKAIVS
ncbi:MAG: hypothetical protein J1F39_00405 [Clostridiales bacterium]|nr:hypothetical protein [Clostridiales bacterium]